MPIHHAIWKADEAFKERFGDDISEQGCLNPINWRKRLKNNALRQEFQILKFCGCDSTTLGGMWCRPNHTQP
jgi:hypothetical protein